MMDDDDDEMTLGFVAGSVCRSVATLLYFEPLLVACRMGCLLFA